jgi:hypothetical protein
MTIEPEFLSQTNYVKNKHVSPQNLTTENYFPTVIPKAYIYACL